MKFDVLLTSTPDYANTTFLNELEDEWHDQSFSAAPVAHRCRGVMGEETQEIHARAVAACFEGAIARRPKLDRPVSTDEQIRLPRLLARQAS